MIFLIPFQRETTYDLRPVRNSTIQRAGTGGSLTPLNRPGDHWEIEIDPGPLATLYGRSLLADLVRGVGQKARLLIPQRGIDVGAPGGTPVPHSDGSWFSDGAGYASYSPRVKGDGQSGDTLIVRDVTPHYAIRKGMFLTVVTAEGPTLHIVTKEAVADGGGDLTIPIWPMMWREPVDDDRVELAQPYMEGFIVDDGGQQSGVFRSVRTDSFTIEEG